MFSLELHSLMGNVCSVYQSLELPLSLSVKQRSLIVTGQHIMN